MTSSAASRANLKNYILVTLAYWGFTITDGALRMLVLLYFDSIGYTPLQIASLFLFYEIFGVVTNFLGGWIGSQFGLKVTLYTGIGLQVFSLLMLSWLNRNWAEWIAVLYVMVAQAFSGIAKDLTKMSSKSAIRLVVPQEAQSSLFKWVAVLTGSKNALKGVGFFIGSVLLTAFGFVNALLIMAGGLFLIMFTGLMLPNGMGKIKAKVKFSQLFSKSKEINILSAARFFLFGSRDVWFVVGLPVFLRGTLGWSFYQVGGFLACWVIAYGIIQFLAPTLMQKFGSGQPPTSKTIQFWTFTLTAVPTAIALALQLGIPGNIAIIGGLLLFGVVFAFNSAVHSYLVLAFTDDDKVALNVGFYYMANSGGRLAGTVLSGLVFQYFNLVGCLWTSMLLVLAAGLVSLKLPDPKPFKEIPWKAEGGE
ncbi:organoarsenical effux MFS transporter ArsJ [Umezakia ovalisporum]|uniref:Organoarsenical effux MFS transporter ArsJ n=2 Tax=Umezakia ovalisporum TaxID=75695 RepID=A0AA43GYS2_9CYAN|nr:organoarsenical effux MFS transporter ArsJ [Umezakia ovalisporum]MDH6055671.1 organoarsenical effux MFS transporter ArsJ [Umezakia ovalisporum FSS-43]MDH6063722.1 organoarsenical effux MFS transporter ArsJ [Umezakia ovalisporum FSS-62]MDH6068212.1 organoarsenical effux MFS transporter ArsJ [Umezakia ovalisporum APH033B]MDH6069386.1 organoarsenical effux MFS transporter ArsJ [Umezakia ovalisporum CobakiLakeA]MDH6073661.1 organoarsenical effux MFS transporter ArsJ [Umezakia ovalisporum CS-103